MCKKCLGIDVVDFAQLVKLQHVSTNTPLIPDGDIVIEIAGVNKSCTLTFNHPDNNIYLWKPNAKRLQVTSDDFKKILSVMADINPHSPLESVCVSIDFFDKHIAGCLRGAEITTNCPFQTEHMICDWNGGGLTMDMNICENCMGSIFCIRFDVMGNIETLIIMGGKLDDRISYDICGNNFTEDIKRQIIFNCDMCWQIELSPELIEVWHQHNLPINDEVRFGDIPDEVLSLMRSVGKSCPHYTEHLIFDLNEGAEEESG